MSWCEQAILEEADFFTGAYCGAPLRIGFAADRKSALAYFWGAFLSRKTTMVIHGSRPYKSKTAILFG